MNFIKRLMRQYAGTAEFWKNVWTGLGLSGSRKQPHKDLTDESYGEHPKMVFDLWYGGLKDTEPGGAPVLIFFHGGGFIRGSRFYSKLMRLSHQQGVTVIAAGYRFSNGKSVSIEDSISDAERLLLHLREYAEKYQIDAERVAVCGNSAGGVLALSLALRARNFDLVCSYANNSPTLLDPERFKEVMGLTSIQEFWYLWSKLFNVRKIEELGSERVRGIIDRTSPEVFVRKDAPPIFLEYSRVPPSEGRHSYEENLVDILHSALFGEEFKNQADEVGMDCVLSHPNSKSDLLALDFLLKHLKVENKYERDVVSM